MLEDVSAEVGWAFFISQVCQFVVLVVCASVSFEEFPPSYSIIITLKYEILSMTQ